MSIFPAPDSSARISLGIGIPRQRAASPTIDDVTNGRVSDIHGLAGTCTSAAVIDALETLDGSLTVKASFGDSLFEDDPVVVGSPIPDLVVDGVRLDGLSAERIKRATELHVAHWFGTAANFFAVRIVEVDRTPVVEVLDRVDRVLIAAATLSLVPSGA